MDIADYLGIARRRWWIVAVAVVVCALSAGLFTLVQPKVYTATVRLLIPASAQTAAARTEAAGAATAYAELAMTTPAIEQAKTAAGGITVPVTVQVTADGASPFIDISVSSTDPMTATRVANAYSQSLPTIVSGLEGEGIAAPRFTVLQPALVPTSPTSPDPVRNVLIGLALGLVLGVMLALLREALDGRVRDGVQLERAAGATLLGLVPKEFGKVPLPAHNRPKSRRAEAYRAVRTNLEFLSVHGMPRSVVITSASAGEGKSSLTANLAVVASRAGRSVVVVDGDLRKPSVARYFGLRSPIGLTEVLMGRWSLDQALQQIPGERVAVLSSGTIPAAPGELVGSAAMQAVIEELEHRFDLVLVDSPPLLPVSDALALAVNVDGVVLVARMLDTTRKAVDTAVQAVRKVNAELLGVVGNAAPTRGPGSAYSYGGKYGYGDGYVSKGKLPQGAAQDVTDEVVALEAGGRRAARRHASPIESASTEPAPTEPAPAVAVPTRRPGRREQPPAPEPAMPAPPSWAVPVTLPPPVDVQPAVGPHAPVERQAPVDLTDHGPYGPHGSVQRPEMPYQQWRPRMGAETPGSGAWR